MWYTLPWAFDEFFHQYMPYRWIKKMQVFEAPSHGITTIDQSSLRALDACGPGLATSISILPDVVPFDRIETLHLSFYTRSIPIQLSVLRNITLINSINCLNKHSVLPSTIHLFVFYYVAIVRTMYHQIGQWFRIHFRLYHGRVHYVYLCTISLKQSIIQIVKLSRK